MTHLLNHQDVVGNSRPLVSGDLMGVVVNNNDPRQWGRIQVQIPGILSATAVVVGAGTTSAKGYKQPNIQSGQPAGTGLPWLYPLMPPGTTRVDIPEVGQVVAIRMRNNNPAQGLYLGNYLTGANIPTELLENYPNSVGWKNSKGDWMRVDKKAGTWDFVHHSGFHLTVDDEGNVTATYPGNLTETIDGNVTRTIKGTLSETVDGAVSRTYEGDLTTNVTGTMVNKASVQINNTAPKIMNAGE
jgi:hypothetical protein